MKDAYRFRIRQRDVSLADLEELLLLSTFAAEGLYGSARVKLEFSYEADDQQRAVTVSTENEVGATIARVFLALAQREFGEQAVDVRPVGVAATAHTAGKAA